MNAKWQTDWEHALDMTITVEALLGAKHVGKGRRRTPLQWVEVIRTGLPSSAVDALAKTVRLTQSELAAALGIPDRTLARRKAEGVLNSDESAKFVRLARVIARASEVFEGLEPSLDWLKAPNAALSGATPLSLLDTDVGAETVLDTLGRIEHGVFA
jgi:putative toxin-antitoxin system antitoxin component (TIGR02293 family)